MNRVERDPGGKEVGFALHCSHGSMDREVPDGGFRGPIRDEGAGMNCAAGQCLVLMAS